MHGGFGDLTVTLPPITHDSSIKVVSVAGRILINPAKDGYNVKVNHGSSPARSASTAATLPTG